MSHIRRIPQLVLGLFAAFFLSLSSAQAITIQLEGLVTAASPDPNPIFNVGVGNAVMGSATFDENLLIADPNAAISPLDGMTLSLTIGNATFLETDDFGYPSTPLLYFTNGLLTNIDIISLFDFIGGVIDPFGFSYSLDVLNGAFAITDMNTGARLVEGTLAAVVPVPEPATLLLVLGGLLGFAGRGRRRLITAG